MRLWRWDFVLIYKSTSILNLAQGEFLMVGAYTCLSITLDFGLNFLASFLLTMVFSVILGLAVERLVLRPLNRGTDHIRHHGDPGADLHHKGAGYHAMGERYSTVQYLSGRSPSICGG
jgi:hypothetical protein